MLAERRDGVQADRETELAKREATRGAEPDEVGLRYRREADCAVLQHMREQRLQVRAPLRDEPREAERIEQQPARAQRILGRPAPFRAKARELSCFCCQPERRRNHQAVERIVHALRGHERPRQIHAHLPVDAARMDEVAMRGFSELDCPSAVVLVVRHATGALERAHPAGEVVVVLAVAIPLEVRIVGLARRALRQPLADAQPARRRMRRVGIVRAQHFVHLSDQALGQFEEAPLAAAEVEPEPGVHGKGVGPEVAPRRHLAGKTGRVGECVEDGDRPVFAPVDHIAVLQAIYRVRRLPGVEAWPTPAPPDARWWRTRSSSAACARSP